MVRRDACREGRGEARDVAGVKQGGRMQRKGNKSRRNDDRKKNY